MKLFAFMTVEQFPGAVIVAAGSEEEARALVKAQSIADGAEENRRLDAYHAKREAANAEYKATRPWTPAVEEAWRDRIREIANELRSGSNDQSLYLVAIGDAIELTIPDEPRILLVAPGGSE